MSVEFKGVKYEAMHGETGFNPLPVSEHGHSGDDSCACRYCSETPAKMGKVETGIWDTLATCLTTGRTWKVHYPELHGRAPKRAEH